MTICKSEIRMSNDELRASERKRLRLSGPRALTPNVTVPSPQSPAPNNHSSFVIRHSGFTLVELLVVMAIIAILSALLIGVAATAGESAREARTKSMITRLHTLVMEQYDTYKDRRAPVTDSTIENLRNALPNNQKKLAPALARLYAKRELMLMEMPDRWSDVILNDVGSPVGQPRFYRSTSTSTYGGPTPIVEAYRRQYFSMVASGATEAEITLHQGAECLYMMVMIATADGEARSLFNQSSIGDTDGDGAFEFLDGWGRPISFIRWPVGFESDRQLNARELGSPTDPAWLNAATEDHDPFDPFNVDPTAFRTIPLIVSPGSDEELNLYTARDTTVWPRANSLLNPYATVDSTAGSFFLGSPLDESNTVIDIDGGADNIHNHNITGE